MLSSVATATAPSPCATTDERIATSPPTVLAEWTPKPLEPVTAIAPAVRIDPSIAVSTEMPAESLPSIVIEPPDWITSPWKAPGPVTRMP